MALARRFVKPLRPQTRFGGEWPLRASVCVSQGRDDRTVPRRRPEHAVPYSFRARHVAGAAGTSWRTDLRVVNPGTAPAQVTITLLRSGADNSSLDRNATVSVPAGGQVALSDVLESRFAHTGTAAMLIESARDDLVVTSRTYNLAPDGTYGQFIPGVRDGQALQRSGLPHQHGLCDRRFRKRLRWCDLACPGWFQDR